MAPTLRIVVTALVGAVAGFLLALFVVMVFVEMDMVLPIYVAGMLLGAVVGAAYGIYSLRSDRAPAA